MTFAESYAIITFKVLNFTSQAWLTAADSSRPVWTHTLTVCVPHDVSFTGEVPEDLFLISFFAGIT